MLRFLTRRHRTSTFLLSTESWAQISPSCLKPWPPPVYFWKTWASKTSSGLNWAVSKSWRLNTESKSNTDKRSGVFFFFFTVWKHKFLFLCIKIFACHSSKSFISICGSYQMLVSSLFFCVRSKVFEIVCGSYRRGWQHWTLHSRLVFSSKDWFL